MPTTINLTKTSAAARLGLLPDCSWEQALECFNEKRARLYAQCILPLTPEDERLLHNAVLPFYEALRFLFPIEVQQEQSLQQIAVQPEVIPPPPTEPPPAKLPPPIREKAPVSGSPSGWNARLFLLICWKSIVLFPGFAVGLTALLVTAWWKYVLIDGVFAATFRIQGLAFLPFMCVLAIEGAKVLAIAMKEYRAVHHTNTRFPWARAVKWLQVSVFALSVIGLAALVGACAQEQPGEQDGMSPGLAAFASVKILTEISGFSPATAITLISLLLAATLDLCIYALLGSAAFEIFRIRLVSAATESSIQQNGGIPGSHAAPEWSRPAIVVILVCLTAISLRGVSRYSGYGVIPKGYEAAAGRMVSSDTVLAAQTLLYVSIPNLNLRKEPGLDHEKTEVLALGTPVYYLGKKTDWTQEIDSGEKKIKDCWVKIRTQSGREGWVFGAYVHYYQPK